MYIIRLMMVVIGIACAGIPSRNTGPEEEEADISPEVRSALSELKNHIIAEPPPDSPEKDEQLNEYLRQARKNNLDLKIVEGELAAEEEDLTTSLTKLFPQVDFLAIYERQELSRQEQPEKFENAYTAQFQLEQAIWDGELWGNYRQQKASTASSRYSRDLTEQALENEIAQKYFYLVQSIETVTEEYKQVERLRKQLHDITRMFQSGSQTKDSVSRAQIAYLNQEDSLLQVIQSARTGQSSLNLLLNRSPDKSVRISRLGRIVLYSPDYGRSLELALANRPDIKQRAALLQLAAAGVFLATQNFFPNVSLVGSYGEIDNSGFSLAEPEWDIQINVTIPLIHGGGNWSGRREALILFRNARISLDQIKKQVVAEVNDSLLEIGSTISRIRIVRQISASASEQMEIESILFRDGKISTLDLFQTFQVYIAMRIELINVICDYLTLMSQLKRNLGGVEIPAPLSGPGLSRVIDCRKILDDEVSLHSATPLADQSEGNDDKTPQSGLEDDRRDSKDRQYQ